MNYICSDSQRVEDKPNGLKIKRKLCNNDLPKLNKLRAIDNFIWIIDNDNNDDELLSRTKIINKLNIKKLFVIVNIPNLSNNQQLEMEAKIKKLLQYELSNTSLFVRNQIYDWNIIWETIMDNMNVQDNKTIFNTIVQGAITHRTFFWITGMIIFTVVLCWQLHMSYTCTNHIEWIDNMQNQINVLSDKYDMLEKIVKDDTAVVYEFKVRGGRVVLDN